jgi:hypothetical protein
MAFQASLGKKLAISVSENKPELVAHACNSNYSGGGVRRIVSETRPGKRTRAFQRRKKEWGCGPCAGLPAWNVQVPEFKPQYYNTKAKEREREGERERQRERERE